jgi:sugar lactone lactonase YvrE
MPFFGSLGILITRALVVAVILIGGVVTTIAGNATSGSINGTGTNARFYQPYGVALDSTGTVYVADTMNNLIRKITPEGVVTTLAGRTGGGFFDGTGTNALFSQPLGIIVDSAGNVYIGDLINNCIRKITPAGVVTTLAGRGGDEFFGNVNGTGTNARFNRPFGVALDSAGTLYVGDSNNNSIRKVTPTGVVTTLATGLTTPRGVAVDSAGNVYVACGDNRIRKITPAAVVTILAGGTTGFVNGTGTNAGFNTPMNITVDSVGTVYVADQNNNSSIRKITPAGVVTTLAGGTVGFQDGTGANARFISPRGVAVNSAGTVLYVADSNNHRIRKIV